MASGISLLTRPAQRARVRSGSGIASERDSSTHVSHGCFDQVFPQSSAICCLTSLSPQTRLRVTVAPAEAARPCTCENKRRTPGDLMRRYSVLITIVLCTCFLSLSWGQSASEPVPADNGSPHFIPVFTSNTNIGNSRIFHL